MKIKIVLIILFALAASAIFLTGQQPDARLSATSGQKPRIAIPDFRGVGDAQKYMSTFNATLFDELKNSGILEIVSKAYYPLEIPQQPTDFKPPATAPPARRGEAPRIVKNGPWLTDWSGPPVSANYLAIGYTAPQNGQLVLRGYLFGLSSTDLSTAQRIGKLYFGSMDDDGAKKTAREFAADILTMFGAQSLAGSKIYFVSDRTGNKEIWSMDYDGSNQKQMTFYRTIAKDPAISSDGKMFAFSTLAKSGWQIMVHSTETGKKLPFYNMVTSTIETPEFTPDGKHILFAATVNGWLQICMADTNGSNMTTLSHVKALEVSPRVNPKTGRDVLFISGRSGIEQLWRMTIDGTDISMVTNGEGYVANPAWRPDGQFIAFAWTRGFEPGAYNIFIMDIASKAVTQLTSNMGKNENPWWAPDGNHLAFASTQGRSSQIYTMLADGTGIQKLTTTGNNSQPVWVKGIN